jgi:hypothetical protein
MRIFDLLREWLRRRPAEDPLEGLLRMLAITEEEELDCEQVFALLDRYAERVQSGEDAARLMPLVHKHFELCPDCRELYEALMQLLQSLPG